MRVGCELATIISYPTRASGIIVLLKTSTKYREFFPTLFVTKTTDFQLVFSFEQMRSYHIWRAWYNGSYTMMAKPIRALELHYPMIQFSIIAKIRGQTDPFCTTEPTVQMFIMSTCTSRFHRISFRDILLTL